MTNLPSLLKPPTPLPADLESTPSVFLAGSIDNDSAVDWQSAAIETLNSFNGPLTILNPRRDEWDATWEQRMSHPAFREQVEWELDALSRTTVIAMYFAPNTKAPITLLELGLHAATGKLLVGCPDDYWRKGNVEIVCARHTIPLFNDLDDLLAATVKRLDKSQ